MSANNEMVALPSVAAKVDVKGEAWVIHIPRFGPEGEHFHTYGMLTPYFKGLTEGKLLATKCVNSSCPISKGNGGLWLPPRADCPDCHQSMQWQEVKNLGGIIYTYTRVERGGTGLEIETPYYQIDVKLDEVDTIVKSYLHNRKAIKIGDRVEARFLKGDKATNTSLDLYFELV